MCDHLRFLVHRVLENYRKTHGATGIGIPNDARRLRALRVTKGVDFLMRTNSRIRFWFFDFSRTLAEWAQEARECGCEEITTSSFDAGDELSLYVWVCDVLADKNQGTTKPFPRTLKLFVIRYFRERLQEDLHEYVDSHGRSLAKNAWVYYDAPHYTEYHNPSYRSHIWKIRSSPPQTAKYELISLDAKEEMEVTIEDMERNGGVKLADYDLDDLRDHEEALCRHAVFRDCFFDNVRATRARAVAVTLKAAASSFGPAPDRTGAVPSHSISDEEGIHAQVTKSVNLFKAKRAALSNLNQTGKRSRFASFQSKRNK